jgi:transcription elongation factor Elf1
VNQNSASELPCPFCNRQGSSPVTFTWWGGLVGPRMLSVVECKGCGKQFNGKTGKSNTQGIIIYSVVMFVVALLVFWLIQSNTR